MEQSNNFYQQTLDYLYSFIPEKRKAFTGEAGIRRTKNLLQLLDNPQEKIKVIHIAGTSGKGSTAYLTSLLLAQQGFKTGLQVSPHLLDIRERFQINSVLISKEKFTLYTAEIIPLIEKCKVTQWGKLTFFEINVCLAFYIFYKEKVDYAVMETGLGGLFDATNVVQNPGKLALLTKIGLDHMSVLGRTLSDIASQKAGIIRKGNTAITVQQKPTVMNVFHSISKKQHAVLNVLQKNINYKNINISKKGIEFDIKYKDLECKNLILSLIGNYQAENASIALAALYELSQQYNFKINKQKIYLAFGNANFKGRFEVRKIANKEIVLDGSHNPQKIKAFISSLLRIYPGRQFDFLLSFSEGKNQIVTMAGMLKLIIPNANKIYISSFVLEGNDLLHQSVDTEKIASVLRKLGFHNYEIIKTDKNRFLKILAENRLALVITGSLYFIGSIYTHLTPVCSPLGRKSGLDGIILKK